VKARVVQRRPWTAIDLFAGAGGFSEGFRQAGFHTVVANDFDPWAAATYSDNHAGHGAHMIVGDICSSHIKAQLIECARGQQIDVVIGGPPCQAFSQVRNHDRIIKDPRNSLYRQYVSIVETIQPHAFVMENVVGLDSLAGGRVKRQIVEDLQLGGDYCVASTVLDAAMFGVPQSRPRILFVGVRSDLCIRPPFPAGTTLPVPHLERVMQKGRWVYELTASSLSPLDGRIALQTLLDTEALELTTVEQAIGDLCHLQAAGKLLRKPSDDVSPYVEGPTSAYQRARRVGSIALCNADVPSIREDTVRRLVAIPQGGNFRDIPETLNGRYLDGKKWGPDIGRDNLSRKHFSAYRKLHPNIFSWTLNTKADCVYHYSTPRALSVREFARLHSFDDTYRFSNGDRHSRYRQVGNAVPPLLAKAIADSLIPVLSACREDHSIRATIREAEAAD
jgi:DNA (cytosine-5)-methyltransferase 1